MTNNVISELPAVFSQEISNIGFWGVTMTTILSVVFGGLFGGMLGYILAPFFIHKIWQLTSWSEANLKIRCLSMMCLPEPWDLHFCLYQS